MTSRRIRLLFWAGALGSAIFFAGDMLYYDRWGSASGLSDDVWNSIMAGVPAWRHHLGSITGPIGGALWFLGAMGLWACCRRAAPRLAVVMLVFLSTHIFFGVLQHGIYGPMGFVLRYCGVTSEAIVQIAKLEHPFPTQNMPFFPFQAIVYGLLGGKLPPPPCRMIAYRALPRDFRGYF
jgi:hypothetical protein